MSEDEITREDLNCCLAVVQAAPDDAIARRALARAYALNGQDLMGLDQLRKAVELCPDSPEIQYDIGHLYARLDQYEIAIEHVNISIGLDPDDYLPYHFLGMLYTVMGRYGRAIQYLFKAMFRAPLHFRIYVSISQWVAVVTLRFLMNF